MVNKTYFGGAYKNRKVLVTGDTGFKGSWLVMCLLELGAEVIGYALEPKTDQDNYVICNLSNKYNHINADIRDYDKLSQVIKEYEPEIIFHLAAQALVLESYKNPLETFSINMMGTLNILEIARKNDFVRAVVNVTSDKCYQNNEWLYSYREIDPLGGNDPYSASKAASEIINNSYLNSFFKTSNSALIASARAGNVIGGGDYSENRLVPDCVKAIRNDQEIIIRNPNSIRPWQYVLEPLYGYLLLGEKLLSKDMTFSGAWNFGPENKNFVTVKNLVEKIIKYSKKGSFEIKESLSAPKESTFLRLDTSKANYILKWNSILDIEKSIECTINDYSIEKESKEVVFNQRLESLREYLKKQNLEV